MAHLLCSLPAGPVAVSRHALARSHSCSHGPRTVYSKSSPPCSLFSQLHRAQRELCLSVQQHRPVGGRGNGRFRHNNIVAAVEGGNLVFGCRIPQHYFVTSGVGDTDEGAGDDPWETGSYDIALQKAGIADFNIQTYTSVMPPEAVLVSLENAKGYFHHGAVLECIMASMNGVKGDTISAGVGRAKVRKIDDQTFIGGYAAEYKGNGTETYVKEHLQQDLVGIFNRRFDQTTYEIYDIEYTIQATEVTKAYGTVLASICFVSFIEPIFQIKVAN